MLISTEYFNVYWKINSFLAVLEVSKYTKKTLGCPYLSMPLFFLLNWEI